MYIYGLLSLQNVKAKFLTRAYCGHVATGNPAHNGADCN